MKIVVCAKLVPDPSSPQSLDSSFYLDRSGKLLLDESDTYGVEMALQLVEADGSGEVVVVSMSPSEDTTGIRNALAMGATRALIVSAPGLRGTDALGTAKVLAAAIGPLAPDVVVCATESSDGYTGTVPVQLAEILSLPAVTFARSVQTQGDGTLRIERQTEEGYDDLTVTTPCVLTVTAGVNVPRYASFKGIMSAKSKPVEIVDPDDLIGEDQYGQRGARQRITEVIASPARATGVTVSDDGEGSAVDEIVQFLESAKVI